MTVDVGALVAAARDARHNAYAPYSGFAVGAAVALADGTLVHGANFENASYGLSLCAETVALAAASAQGRLGQAVAIAVVADSADGAPVTPCGRCRQILAEAQQVAGRAIAVYCAPATGEGEVVRFGVADLLPHSFGATQL